MTSTPICCAVVALLMCLAGADETDLGGLDFSTPFDDEVAILSCSEDEFFPEQMGFEEEFSDSTLSHYCSDVDENEQTESAEGDVEGDKRRVAKSCCRIGAFVGKKYVRRHQCPYVQCRKFAQKFIRRHKRCLKGNKKVCGHFFVSCCTRQHHKNLYAPRVQSDGFLPIGSDPFVLSVQPGPVESVPKASRNDVDSSEE